MSTPEAKGTSEARRDRTGAPAAVRDRITTAELTRPQSARVSGPATTAKQERCPIYVTLAPKNLSSPRQTLLLGMPNFLRGNLSFDVVTWAWISENDGEPRGRKRSQPDTTDISSAGLDSEHEEPEDGLKIWGYMPGHVHFNLGYTNGRVSRIIFLSSGNTLTLHSPP